MKNGVKGKIVVGLLGFTLLSGAALVAPAQTLAGNVPDKAVLSPVSSLIVENTSDNEVNRASEYRVTAKVLAVRSGPGTNYPAVGQVVEGDILTENTDLSPGGAGWKGIKKGQLSGYVDSRYIVEI